jgi:hypothetical protein
MQSPNITIGCGIAADEDFPVLLNGETARFIAGGE